MENIHNQYLAIHNERINQFGFTEKALWGSKASQYKRFEIFEKLFLNENKFNLLDIGCGLCDFYKFLTDRKFYVDYTGLEINESFCKESKFRYPDINIVMGDCKSIPSNIQWDYVVASGIYNLGKSVEEAEEAFLSDFSILYPNIQIGFAVNFLSSNSENKDNISIYHNPGRILTLIQSNISKNVVLFHHYLPNDFTILVYKNRIGSF